MNIKTMLIAAGMAVLLTAPMVAAGPKGTLKGNKEMTKAFREGTPPANLRYYATGRDNAPYAVVGLDPKWQQTARFWNEIGPDPQEVAKKVANTINVLENDPRASDIIAPDGTVIGVYWSSLYSTTVKMGEGNTVQVFKPRMPTRF